MSVYCGYCGKRGHNKLGCPQRKAEARANPDGYLARQIAREEEVRKRAVANRSCTYCDESGHNRRGCGTLKEDRRLILKRQKEYLDEFLASCASVGFGPGSLIRIPHGNSHDPFSKQVLALVTDFNWQHIDFMNLDSDPNRQWGIRSRAIANARVVSHEGFDSSDNHWSGPPTHNSKVVIQHASLSGVLSSISSPEEDARSHEMLQIVGPANGGFSVPEAIITNMVNESFNLIPSKRAKPWEKSRMNLAERTWSKIRPDEHKKSIKIIT